jgi:AMP nucleosidase
VLHAVQGKRAAVHRRCGIKLAGMASEFYRQRVGQHLEIGLKTIEKLKRQEWERLHSRKLRSFAEVAFQ